jgi:hypothetical protein
MATSVVAASASTSFGSARTEPLVIKVETASGFGATSSEVAVLGEPVTRSVSVVHGSRTLLSF